MLSDTHGECSTTLLHNMLFVAYAVAFAAVIWMLCTAMKKALAKPVDPWETLRNEAVLEAKIHALRFTPEGRRILREAVGAVFEAKWAEYERRKTNAFLL